MGIIGAGEYFLVENNSPIVYGLEDWNIYLDNHKRLKSLTILMGDRLKIANIIENKYNNIISKCLPSSIIEFISNLYNLFSTKNISYHDCNNLKEKIDFCCKHGSISDFKSINCWIEIQKEFLKIDFEVVNDELKIFNEEMRKGLSYRDYVELFELFNYKEIADNFFLVLRSIVKKYFPDFNKKYPNLQNYIEFSWLNFKLNVLDLIKEIDILTSDLVNYYVLQNELFSNKDDIIVLLKMTKLFKNFISLSLNTYEYFYFKKMGININCY